MATIYIRPYIYISEMYYVINIFRRFSHLIKLGYVLSKFIFDFGNQSLARTYVTILEHSILNLVNLVGISFFCHQTEIFFIKSISKYWKNLKTAMKIFARVLIARKIPSYLPSYFYVANFIFYNCA